MKQKKGFLAEFKEFISRGSVIDLAVGVIIGSSFTAIANSLVGDIIMPVFGWIMSGASLSDYQYALSDENAIFYGKFLQSILNFLLIGFVIFVLVKGINVFRRKKEDEPVAEVAVEPQIELLTEIRDLLKKD